MIIIATKLALFSKKALQYSDTYSSILHMTKTIHRKRSDTLVRTIERKYGVDLGYRSDAELHTVLKREGLPSLSRLLKMTQKRGN